MHAQLLLGFLLARGRFSPASGTTISEAGAAASQRVKLAEISAIPALHPRSGVIFHGVSLAGGQSRSNVSRPIRRDPFRPIITLEYPGAPGQRFPPFNYRLAIRPPLDLHREHYFLITSGDPRASSGVNRRDSSSANRGNRLS